MTQQGSGGIFQRVGVEPISTTIAIGPCTNCRQTAKGLAALEMLNSHWRHFPLRAGKKDYGYGTVNALHAMIEAKKLAYADLKEIYRAIRAARNWPSGGRCFRKSNAACPGRN